MNSMKFFPWGGGGGGGGGANLGVKKKYGQTGGDKQYGATEVYAQCGQWHIGF
jgi:hypothetical protein